MRPGKVSSGGLFYWRVPVCWRSRKNSSQFMRGSPRMRALSVIDIGLVVEHADHGPRGVLEPLLLAS